MNENDSFKIPADWGEDLLSLFIKNANENCILGFTHFRYMFNVLREVDDIFREISVLRIPPDMPLLPSFVSRSWHSFQAAVRISLSGQVVESYGLIRSGLECAAYAHFIGRSEARTRIWLDRGSSEAATQNCRQTFTWGQVRKELSPSIGSSVQKLYEATIRYGAHPNVDGHIVAADWNDDGVISQDLIPGTIPWKVCIQHLRDSGICCLNVFAIMLEEQFQNTPLGPRLNTLKHQLDDMRFNEPN